MEDFSHKIKELADFVLEKSKGIDVPLEHIRDVAIAYAQDDYFDVLRYLWLSKKMGSMPLYVFQTCDDPRVKDFWRRMSEGTIEWPPDTDDYWKHKYMKLANWQLGKFLDESDLDYVKANYTRLGTIALLRYEWPDVETELKRIFSNIQRHELSDLLDHADQRPVIPDTLIQSLELGAYRVERYKEGTDGLWVRIDAIVDQIAPKDDDAYFDALPNLKANLSRFKKSGCFVATHLYGAHSVEVARLRTFRDDVLLPRLSGRAFVALYYRVSPFLVRRMETSKSLRITLQWLVAQVLKRL